MEAPLENSERIHSELCVCVYGNTFSTCACRVNHPLYLINIKETVDSYLNKLYTTRDSPELDPKMGHDIHDSLLTCSVCTKKRERAYRCIELKCFQ